MAPKHSNPTKPRYDRKSNTQQSAVAPYNFIPLPEQVVSAREPLAHDRYHFEDGLSGWIEVECETVSPTYIRGVMTPEAYASYGEKSIEEMSETEKNERADFYATTNASSNGERLPALPGSSLRGMFRNLVEIVTFSRMRRIASAPTFTFRAVAAAKDDPLQQPYQNVIGRFGSNVRAGYLQKKGDQWFILPAKTPADFDWPEKGAYLKLKERVIRANEIPNFVLLNHANYKPGHYKVSFDVDVKRGKKGRYVAVTRIGPASAGYEHRGVLVCSGNMLETGQKNQKSPRKNHTLILQPLAGVKPIPISQQAIDDYLAGLTPFQKEELTAWSENGDGCLSDKAPVFYVREHSGKVVYFGHNPNFRIPARLHGESRAATPRDFVPQPSTAAPDMADAIFGWVEDDMHEGLIGNYAGRVSFTDAVYQDDQNGIWYEESPITPHTLSGPKPTTFQHYLVQDQSQSHDPDKKVALAHYGSSPNKTQIRGFKLYWHKGDNPDLKASKKELEHPKQLTRIKPIKPGVRFAFKIHFTNLRKEELGALLWTLSLPGDDETACRHKIGMGKPLGMGAVNIERENLTLKLVNPDKRYRALFADHQWAESAEPVSLQTYVDEFETYILKALNVTDAKFKELERIAMLLTMLQWREGDDDWLAKTRYMEFEHGPKKVNEYNQRPVLPDPLAVAGAKVKIVQAKSKPQSQPVKANEKTGIVKKFGLGQSKSFGFIQPDGGGSDVFVHRSQLVQGLTDLSVGQRVIYEVVRGQRGMEARNVRLLP